MNKILKTVSSLTNVIYKSRYLMQCLRFCFYYSWRSFKELNLFSTSSLVKPLDILTNEMMSLTQLNRFSFKSYHLCFIWSQLEPNLLNSKGFSAYSIYIYLNFEISEEYKISRYKVKRNRELVSHKFAWCHQL